MFFFNFGDLDREITEARNSLTTNRLDMSFGEIIGMYGKQEIIISPDFQRLYRWSVQQRTRFLESILLGIPIPPIFVAENKDGQWELVDGLQRVSTILSFFGELKGPDAKKHNGWKCEEASLLPSLNGISVETMPKKYLLNIRRAVCRIEVIQWDSKWDMRYELFNRLNTGGTPLTAQEIRNCIFRGGLKRFYAFIREAKNSELFKNVIPLTTAQKQRLFDEDLIVRFVALVDDWGRVDSPIAEFATSYMQELLQSHRDIDQRSIERFYRVLKLLEPIGHSTFKVKSTFSSSLYDAVMIALASNLRAYEKSPERVRIALDELKHSEAFRSLRGSASSKSRTKKKIDLAIELFKGVVS